MPIKKPVGTAAPAVRPSAARLSLPFSLTASQFLHFRLLRTSRIITRLERILRFPLLARGAFGFLAVFLAEFRCICHEYFLTP